MKIFTRFIWLIVLLGVSLLSACGSDNDRAPAISTQPAAQTVPAGAVAVFSVTASGTDPLRYQWRKNAVDISGATERTYTTPATSLVDNNARYSVVVSNGVGSVTSDEALLTVTVVVAAQTHIQGQVLTASGTPISGATVRVNTASTTSDALGQYQLDVQAADRLIALISAPGFTGTARITAGTAGGATTLNSQLLPVGINQSVVVASGGTVLVPQSTAQVVIPANSLVRVGGGTAASSVQVAVTPIDPAIDVNRMPGDYTTLVNGTPTSIESFGAIAVEIHDATGAQYNLNSGALATIRIPVSTRAVGAAIPATIPLFFFDEVSGRWVQEGTATLAGVGSSRYYEGTVGHFSVWNADQVLNTVSVSGCIRNSANQPVAGAFIQTDGIDYTGVSTAVSLADGSFTVLIKRSAQATITGLSGNLLSNTVSTTPASANFSLPACLVLSTTVASLNVRLTWGASPSDVDSHMLLPSGEEIDFTNRGFLAATPFAALDVDDTSGFGPEIITVTRLMVGRYRYYVHNFSGTFPPGLSGSPVRVELNRNGSLSSFSPPAGETAATNFWHVFDLVVAPDCSVTLTAGTGLLALPPGGPASSTPVFCTAP